MNDPQKPPPHFNPEPMFGLRLRDPVLVGDGVHDDTRALEAMVNRRPFTDARVGWPNKHHRHRITRTIIVGPTEHTSFTDAIGEATILFAPP